MTWKKLPSSVDFSIGIGKATPPSKSSRPLYFAIGDTIGMEDNAFAAPADTPAI